MNAKSIMCTVLLTCCLGIAGCSTYLPKVEKVNKSSDYTSQKGNFYCLPKQLLKVTIPIINTTYKRGSIYTAYEELGNPEKAIESDNTEKIQIIKETLQKAVRDYILSQLGIDLPKPTKTQPSYSIGNIEISSEQKPDENAIFYADIGAGYLKDVDTTINFNEDNTITGVKTTVKDTSFKTAVEAAKSTAQIIGTLISPARGTTKSSPSRTAKIREELSIESNIPLTPKDETILILIIDQVTEVKNARAAIVKLIKGEGISEFPHPGDYQSVLENLHKYEEELTNPFHIISSSRVTNTLIFMFDPTNLKREAGATCQQYLMTLDTKNGIAGINDSISMNETIDLKKNTESNSDEIACSIRLTLESQMSLMLESDDMKKSGSFFYRIPATVKAQTVLHKASQKPTLGAPVELTIPQLGIIRQLPNRFSGSYASIDTEFYDDTGSLKKLIFSTKGLELSGEIKELSNSTNELLKKYIELSQKK